MSAEMLSRRAGLPAADCGHLVAMMRVAAGIEGARGPMISICDNQRQRARACPGYGVGAAGDGRRDGDRGGGRRRRAAGGLGEDFRSGRRAVDLFLEKRRLVCGNGGCPRGTFTEWAPQVPPRCRITRRLLEHCGDEVAERGITPAGSARHNGVSWPSAHGAFAKKADTLLGEDPEPAAHLGIDEHRRGRARWRRDEQTGEYTLLADRWHTCCYDLSGDQGMLGQVEGRTADDAAYWLAGATQDWRDAVTVVAIDMCTIYQSAVQRMLPGAKIAVDLFHVVQLAVKTVAGVRRRAIRELYGRRGKAGDPEYGIKHLLEKNLEDLSGEQFGKIIGTLDATGPGQH